MGKLWIHLCDCYIVVYSVVDIGVHKTLFTVKQNIKGIIIICNVTLLAIRYIFQMNSEHIISWPLDVKISPNEYYNYRMQH